MDKTYIGKRIKQYRKANGITQHEMAERLELSQNYLGAIERGVKIPKLETFIKIANELSVSSDYLLMDVIDTGKKSQVSELEEKLEGLTSKDIKIINGVVDTLISNLKNK